MRDVTMAGEPTDVGTCKEILQVRLDGRLSEQSVIKDYLTTAATQVEWESDIELEAGVALKSLEGKRRKDKRVS